MAGGVSSLWLLLCGSDCQIGVTINVATEDSSEIHCKKIFARHGDKMSVPRFGPGSMFVLFQDPLHRLAGNAVDTQLPKHAENPGVAPLVFAGQLQHEVADFIGSHTVESYLAAGHAPFVIDDLSTGLRGNVSDGVPFF